MQGAPSKYDDGDDDHDHDYYQCKLESVAPFGRPDWLAWK